MLIEQRTYWTFGRKRNIFAGMCRNEIPFSRNVPLGLQECQVPFLHKKNRILVPGRKFPKRGSQIAGTAAGMHNLDSGSPLESK